MIDDRTPNLNLPLASVDNLQTEEIPRLRVAMEILDAAVASKADLVGGKVPASQLPSYVDDVLEYVNLAAFPVAGETGKLYLALDSGLLYRWSGSAYTDLPANYTLPSATPSTLGGVKIGPGLNVGPDGTISTVGGGAGSGLPVFNEMVITPTTNGQTVFTPVDGYEAGQIELFLNGVLLLGNGDDYSATDGVNITLTIGVNTTDTLLLRRWIYLPEAQAVAKTGDTMTGALNWAPPASVASAATCNIGLASSNLVLITGTTTITSLGVIAAGVQRTVVFDDSLTLTHSDGLILPGSANIKTAAGDAAVFQSVVGGWRCTGYQAAASVSVSPNSIVVLTSGTSWTCPAGVTKAVITVVGGCGGAGGLYTTNSYMGGAGGGGGAAKSVISLSPGTAYSYAIGAGGTAGTNGESPTAGGTGGTSTWGTLSATGGAGGAASTSVFNLGGAGGTASGGQLNVAGGNGESGYLTARAFCPGMSGFGLSKGGVSGNTPTAGDAGRIILELYK